MTLVAYAVINSDLDCYWCLAWLSDFFNFFVFLFAVADSFLFIVIELRSELKFLFDY